MKNRVTRAGLMLLVVALLLSLFGCGKPAARYFSYLDAPFCATLTGKIDGLAFAATLDSEGREEVGTPPTATLTFSAPLSLAGIKVCFYPETGWKTSLGDLQGASGGEGMGQVAALLLTERSVSGTRREAGCVILTLDGGAELWLDEKTGLPHRVTYIGDGRSVEVAVVGWE